MSTEADGTAATEVGTGADAPTDLNPKAGANRETVQAFWSALYERDWDAIGRFFAADSEYTDVPSPDDDVARGPDQIVARLRLGLERISGYEHALRLMVAEGDVVVEPPCAPIPATSMPIAAWAICWPRSAMWRVRGRIATRASRTIS